MENPERISQEVWEALPRRLLVLIAVALVMIAAIPLKGCGIVKPDPDYMYGPKSTFEKHERYSGGD